ncbi:MAG: hypothetical protein EBS04_01900 [Chitinophagia bacterium]|nr:hypothetical protein [Chitinophagia bacterium]
MKKFLLYLILAFGLFSQTDAIGAKGKAVAKKATQIKPTSKTSKSKKGTKKKSSKYSKSKKKSSKSKKSVAKVAPVVRTAQWQMIAQNKEQSRIKDSVQKTKLVQESTTVNEGYFASFFSNQKKAATFQTLNGTAAVFKSMSGWKDNKFYILTNELPVGTIVRITTSDLKSICAKVINALPEVGSAIQYRLNDAAAAILGVTNKTFQVSVTY